MVAKLTESVCGQGVAINGVPARVDKDGRVPAGLLEPKIVACEGGSARVTLGGLTGAFVVVE